MKKLLSLFIVVAMTTLTSVAFADVGKVKSQPSIAQAQSQMPECSVVAVTMDANILLPAVEVNTVPDLNSSTVALTENGCAEVNSSNQNFINTKDAYKGKDNSMVMSLTTKDKLQMANNSSGTYPYNFSLKTEAQQNLAMVNMTTEESLIKKAAAMNSGNKVKGSVMVMNTTPMV